MKKIKKEKAPIIIISILVLILVGMFWFSYNENQKGLLQINTLDQTLVFYIDNTKEESENDINPKFKIKKGDHTVIVYKEGSWPWTKEIKIIEQKTIKINPFFVPQNTSGFIIKKADSDYWKILARFKQNLISSDAYNKIPSLEIKNQITAIDFYKNREDVILMALAEGIYALGIDYETEQNLQPIYKGTNPLFIKKDDNTIYILDNNNLMEVAY